MPLSDEYVLISGLQHLLFCPRQWALIHIERQWQENIFTAQGRLLHEKAHSDESENRPGLHVARGLPLRCERLKISGVADVVEFYHDDAGVPLPGQKGTWRPYPVEYKHGRPKTKDCDRIQLCAQAACLEEMLDCRIETGALFYGTPRRREEVAFSPQLRAEMEDACAQAHQLLDAGVVPPAVLLPHCKSCSVSDICQPKMSRTVGNYLKKHLEEAAV
ncbi:CRISPR-associated protein Cas4 [Pyramidobacter porci]